MFKNVLMALLFIAFAVGANGQNYKKLTGSCGNDVKWSYDGYTLTISNGNNRGEMSEMDDFDLSNNTPGWIKKECDIRKINIGEGIYKIGSCAFANLPNLQEVEFKSNDVSWIGWGAFMNCPNLRTLSIPTNVRTIETIAFANCNSLSSVKIPDQCRVADKAFLSCTNLKVLDLSPTAILGHHVFATEENSNGKLKRTFFNGDLLKVPSYINENNCNEYGLSKASLARLGNGNAKEGVDYDYLTSDIDKDIPIGNFTRNNTFALIIGNQNYRFASEVPYAIHDARIFSEYCNKTLGIPASNIHLTEDATKQMLLEDEIQDWLALIPEKENKNLIIYYAGHGVPDTHNKNRAYLLPTDVRGTSPHRGVALEDLYEQIGDMNFQNATIFLDACFSGVNRNNEGVTEGLRGVEIEAEEAKLTQAPMIVFSAAQGNETAQGYPEHGHGLFTYFLLKTLNETKGMITFGQLAQILKNNVSETADGLKLRKKQSPTTVASEVHGEAWRRLTF